MKKLIIFLVTLATLLTGCSSSHSNSSATDYKYAEYWEPSVIIPKDDSYNEELYAHSEAVDFDLTLFKQIITDCLKSREDLDWENFNQSQSIRIVSAKSDDEIRGMSEDAVMIILNYRAIYDNKTNSLLLLPAFFETTQEMTVHVIVHELIHALISTGHDSYTRLEEGLVDMYTTRILQNMGLQPHPVYIGEIVAIQWLIAIYGEDAVLTAALNGDFVSMIDSATKPGMHDKLSTALLIAHAGSTTDSETTEAVNVELDILAHIARNEHKEEAVLGCWGLAQQVYADITMAIDAEYIDTLLNPPA